MTAGLARRDAKRDANEPDIVAALEAAGATVYRLSAAGVAVAVLRSVDDAVAWLNALVS